MITEFITRKFLTETLASYAIQQAIDKLLVFIFKLQEKNDILLKSSFNIAKESLSLANLHLRNGEIKEYYEELEFAAKNFRDSAAKLEGEEKIQALCLTGICYKFLGNNTKKKFFFERALSDLDEMIKDRVRLRIRKNRVTSIEIAEKRAEKAKKRKKISDSVGMDKASERQKLILQFSVAFAFSVLLLAFLILSGGSLFSINYNMLWQGARLASLLVGIVYGYFWLRSEKARMQIESQVVEEEFPGFENTTIRQLKIALEKGIV
jgi:tetratricopeptide (TPR) repeat protein